MRSPCVSALGRRRRLWGAGCPHGAMRAGAPRGGACCVEVPRAGRLALRGGPQGHWLAHGATGEKPPSATPFPPATKIGARRVRRRASDSSSAAVVCWRRAWASGIGRGMGGWGSCIRPAAAVLPASYSPITRTPAIARCYPTHSARTTCAATSSSGTVARSWCRLLSVEPAGRHELVHTRASIDEAARTTCDRCCGVAQVAAGGAVVAGGAHQPCIAGVASTVGRGATAGSTSYDDGSRTCPGPACLAQALAVFLGRTSVSGGHGVGELRAADRRLRGLVVLGPRARHPHGDRV